MVEKFQAAAAKLVDESFPMKEVTIVENDKPWFTEELRKVRRMRDRAYQRGGRSATYFKHQQDFQRKLEKETAKYKKKLLNEVMEGKRGSSYSSIRKLGENSEDSERRKQFDIPAFVNEGLTADQAACRLADHFSKISQTVAPLNISNFQPSLQEKIEEGKADTNKPVISQHSVYRQLLKIKKPNSKVEGDIPKKLIQEYPFLWAGPAAIIFNQIIQSAKWPQEWKKEHCIVLHKTGDPRLVKSEDDTRTISKTNFLSKLLESLLA